LKFTKGMLFKWSIKNGTRYAEITAVGDNLLYLRIISNGEEIFVNRLSWTRKVLDGKVIVYRIVGALEKISFGEQQMLEI